MHFEILRKDESMRGTAHLNIPPKVSIITSWKHFERLGKDESMRDSAHFYTHFQKSLYHCLKFDQEAVETD